ncbi:MULTISPECIES: hypothetical protein [Spirulina sp. CCY15215]|uniref:hypothetical protein n=1 Tax=Spirulina sp. CCY15215 TaxID=2767591 RepID=UPI00194E888F|nr:hypothetical protein [Spirulina major]
MENSLHLERYIRFFKERRPDRRVVYHGIHFHLNEEILEQIQQARSQGHSLFVKPKFISDLRYYLLFDEYSGLNCGINVSTHYFQDNSEQAVLRSLMSLDGDVLFQIDQRYLEQPELSLSLTSAHYWLIAQLLDKLKLEGTLWLNFLSWSLSLSAIVPYLFELWQQDRLELLTIVVTSLFSWVIQRLFRYILKLVMGQIWQFLFKQMLTGELSNRYQLKKVIVWILRRLRL